MKRIALLLLCLPAVAAEFPDDPFAAENIEEHSPYQNHLSLLGYYQSNWVNSEHRFNPGLTKFNDDNSLGVLQWQFKADWQSNWQANFNTALIWQDDTSKAKLLEGYLSYTSDDLAWRAQLGRVKTQWSNGYNWSLTNLIRPYRDRPYTDLDDPLQQQGWDMLNLSYGNDEWRTGIYIADKQYSARLTHIGQSDYSFIIHKQAGEKASFASSFSTLLNEATTLRIEWNMQKQREQFLAVGQNDTLHKFVIGGSYTSDSGYNIRLEYLHNQHGFNTSEWRNVEDLSAAAYNNVITGTATEQDYDYLGQSLSSLSNGQLRQNYLYLMLTTPTSENLWQYRQSVQYNTDDGSQLHRLELLKSFNDHFTARVQWEHFNGCNTCEYGLNPNKNNLRLVLKHVF